MNRAPTWVRPAANEGNARGRGMRPAHPRMTGPVIPTQKPRARSEGKQRETGELAGEMHFRSRVSAIGKQARVVGFG